MMIIVIVITRSRKRERERGQPKKDSRPQLTRVSNFKAYSLPTYVESCNIESSNVILILLCVFLSKTQF